MTIGTEKAIVRQPQTELALPNQGTSLMSVASQQDWLAQLPEHEFETVQVDATGSIKQREQKRNKYFRQDLGAGVYLDLMHIPAGVFLMGSPEHEQDRRESEGPQHWVKVSEFFMGRYPITQAQWRAVSALPQINRKLPPDPSHFKGEQRPPDPSYFKGEQRPVERVSWYEAVEFCDRLSVYSQQTYRLPCEAEWEYACRAGTTTPFYFGETIAPNYDSRFQGKKGELREEEIEMLPVGALKAPNAWGLEDMHGNIEQWCLDHLHSDYQDKPEELKAQGNTEWLSSDESKRRLLRGSSWLSAAKYCRSASRLFANPDTRDLDLGFRVVCRSPRTR